MKLIERIQARLAAVNAEDEKVEAQKKQLTALLAGLLPENEDLLIEIVKEHVKDVVVTAAERGPVDSETTEQVTAIIIPELAGHAELLDQTAGETLADLGQGTSEIPVADSAVPNPEAPSLPDVPIVDSVHTEPTPNA